MFKKHIVPDERSVYRMAVQRIIEQIKKKSNSVLLLPVGQTYGPFYRLLIAKVQSCALDMSAVRLFTLDECYGLDRSGPARVSNLLRPLFIAHIGVRESHLNRIEGGPEDLASYRTQYKQVLPEMEDVDLALFGIGANGQFAFHKSETKFTSRTRRVDLTKGRRATFYLFKKTGVQNEASTGGIATVLDAKSCILMACGQQKAMTIQSMVDGPISSTIPASALRLHSEATLLLDAAAAQYLQPLWQDVCDSSGIKFQPIPPYWDEGYRWTGGPY